MDYREYRKIDRLVAEKVMGWRLKSSPGPGGGYVAWVNDDGMVMSYETDCTMHIPSEYYWRPTKNIANAWRVAEKLSEDGYDFELWKDKNEYNVEFYIQKEPRFIFSHANAETAPLAICLAALKAVGAE